MQLAIRRTPWLITGMFCLVVIVSGWGLWSAFVHQPSRITIALDNPLLVDGTQGVDPDGVWFDGNTRINLNRFHDMPWRLVSWRWRQPPGDTLPVTLTLDTYAWQSTTTEKWRVVHLLMPAETTMLHVTSDTRVVVGDVRNLGIMMDALAIKRLQPHWFALPQWLFMLVFAFDYWVVVIAAAIWLRHANWVGLVVFSAFVLLYSILFSQEAAHGFANPTLLIDRGGRYAVTVFMAVRAWQQRTYQLESTPEKSRRFGIDVLRAVAILCVVIAHFMPLVFTEWTSTRDFFKWFLAMGSLGVNVFFALSGYLIGIILMRHIAHIHQFAVVKRFWIRRWLRTLPAAYVSAVISWIVATPNNVGDFFRSIFFVGTIHPLYISTEIPFWWSLGTEELFYVLFPLALFALVKLVPRMTAMAIVLATIVIASFLGRYLWMINIPKDAWKAIEYVMYIRLDAMVWGILIAWMRVARPHWFRSVAELGYAPGIMTVAIGIMVYVDYLRWPVLAVMIPQTCITVGTSLLIPACENLKTLGWQLVDRVVVWIAFISYSLYLYHVMVMLRLSREIGPATSWGMLGTNALLYLVGAIGLAALSYYFVEKPVLTWRDRTFSDKVE
ncbi:MAG: hypothetical protein RL076_2382 [Chloroflexota bacterium]